MQVSEHEHPAHHVCPRISVEKMPVLYSVCQELPHMLVIVQWLSCVRLFVTPWTVACRASLSMEFSRQEYRSGLPFPSPGDLPDPGIEPVPPASAGGFIYH